MSDMDELTRFMLDEVKAANDALAAMRDKGCRWWKYSVSHKTFDFVVGEPTGEENVALCLAACRHISGPTDWPTQQLEVSRDVQGTRWFVIQDIAAGFKAEGIHFAWKRNFDLLRNKSIHLGPGIGV